MMMMMMMMTTVMMSLITGVWTFPAVVSRTYETPQDNHITISWDFHTQTDLSSPASTNLLCLLLSNPPKVLYQMTHGGEVGESDQQFAGRVQLDNDALRGGRFRLGLSHVVAEDSGTYRCEVVHYDETRSRWELASSETFVVNVSRIPDGNNSDESLTTGAGWMEGSKAKQGNQLGDYIYLGVFIGFLLSVVVAAYGKLLCVRPPDKESCVDANADLPAAAANGAVQFTSNHGSPVVLLADNGPG